MNNFYFSGPKPAITDRLISGFRSLFVSGFLFLLIPYSTFITWDDPLQVVDGDKKVFLPIPDEVPPPVDEQDQEEEELNIDMKEDVQPPDLDAIAMIIGGITLNGDYRADFSWAVNVDDFKIYEEDEVDETPQPIFMAKPILPYGISKSNTVLVNVVFVVDETGQVTSPKIESSTNSAYNTPVLNAIRRWKFRPGTQSGEPVSVRMCQPFTFRSQ